MRAVILRHFSCVRVRSLNELRVLLLDSPRHSPGMDRDLSREVHKAEWKMKEQKLQDDIKSLREKLLLLVSLLTSTILIYFIRAVQTLRGFREYSEWMCRFTLVAVFALIKSGLS